MLAWSQTTFIFLRMPPIRYNRSDDTRECTTCHVVKPMVQYNKKRDGLASRCRTCSAEYHRRRRQTPLATVPTEKKCSKCKLVRPIGDFNKSGVRYRSNCKHCGVSSRVAYDDSDAGFIVNLVKASRGTTQTRQANGRDHDIDVDYINDLLAQQNNKCALSNVPLALARNTKWQCSLDRIDTSMGYVRGNVRLTALEFNTAKQWTPEKIRLAFRDRATIPAPPTPDFYPVRTATVHEHHTRESDGAVKCWICHEYKAPGDFNNASSGNGCKSCASEYRRQLRKTWPGRLRLMVSNAKINHGRRAASDRALVGEFGITYDLLVSLYRRQDGRCHYSGVPLQPDGDQDWLVSLERLDLTKTYTVDNVALICAEFNSIDRGNTGWSTEKVQDVRTANGW